MTYRISSTPQQRQPVRWRFEFDEFFGVWQLIPWLIVSTPTKGVPTEQHWNVSIGWLRWGWTLSVGRFA
jgi:hypothetical protein